MPEKHNRSLLPAARQGEKAMKPPQLKGVICLAVIISVTILALTWMTRGRLCEVHYSGGGVELAAFMACSPGK
ncbi:type I toxin-antitoxin system Hok family toxin [Salmonella enterica]|nr:type I toxin-antitoxin system Hok family toxin [Salmonella enterica]